MVMVTLSSEVCHSVVTGFLLDIDGLEVDLGKLVLSSYVVVYRG
jgi:hypothetical protein